MTFHFPASRTVFTDITVFSNIRPLCFTTVKHGRLPILGGGNQSLKERDSVAFLAFRAEVFKYVLSDVL